MASDESKPTNGDSFGSLGWNKVAIWMGAGLPALLRMYRAHGFRIPPSAWLAAACDLSFGVLNSTLGVLQSALYSRRAAANAAANTNASGDTCSPDPLFILGHWRTGTTLLHELLSLDARHRYPTTYECFLPQHFLVSERWLKPWTTFALPGTRPPDNMKMGWDLPQEDEFALVNLGLPSPYWNIAFPNEPLRADAYYELDTLPTAERERWKRALRRFVSQLTIHKPGRVLLKSPTHTFRLPTLNEMFPRAAYVHLVRNPLEVFSSTCRLWKSVCSVHGYQKPKFDGLEEFVLATFARMHERLEWTRGLIPPECFIDVRYEDLVRDPRGELRRIYEQLSLGEFDAVQPALEQYLSSHRDYQTNRHQLSAEQRDHIARRWKGYIERYGYDVDCAVR